MNVRRCSCNRIINIDRVKKCEVCGQHTSEMTVVPSTSKNIKEAEFFDLVNEIIDDYIEHPEEYFWI